MELTISIRTQSHYNATRFYLIIDYLKVRVDYGVIASVLCVVRHRQSINQLPKVLMDFYRFLLIFHGRTKRNNYLYSEEELDKIIMKIEFSEIYFKKKK